MFLKGRDRDSECEGFFGSGNPKYKETGLDKKVEDGKSEDLGWSHYEHCLENMNDADFAWNAIG